MKHKESLEQEAENIEATTLRRALSILGDPWTMLILKEAFNGTRRFGEFQRNLNIPKQTLSARLVELCNSQMLYRHFLNAKAGTVIYIPTAKTFDLQQAMYSIWLWHRANPSEIDPLPFDLIHDTCGQVLSASYHCEQCGETASNASVHVMRTSPEQFDDEPRARLSRRNDTAITAIVQQPHLPIAASVVGDIPCNEILFRLFQGALNHSRLARELGLGMAVVRNRLDKLITLGLIEEQTEGSLSIFSTSKHADGLYPLLLSIIEWGSRWCNGNFPPPDLLIHDCGKLFRGRFKCKNCNEFVGRNNIKVVKKDAGQ